MSFWEYVYRGFGGGNRDGGFGGGGFGGSDPDSWTTSDDMKNDYNDFVSTLPATGYNSAGKLLWQPKWNDLKDSDFRFSSANYSKSMSDGELSSFSFGEHAAFSFSVHNSHIGISLFESPSNLRGVSFSVNRLCKFSAPISGNYFVQSSDFIGGAFYSTEFSNGSVRKGLLHKSWVSRSVGYYSRASSISCYTLLSDMGYDVTSNPVSFISTSVKLDDGRKLGNIATGSVALYTPVFAIEPISDTTTINNTYNINTRVNNFQGNYYNNVTNNYYNNITIINETTNNYYDMTTNNYYTMSNWSYDYQSRTYFVTLEDGTTITVQFGDDCLTITNNNVENSYQYVINNNNTPSPNPETPSTCKHNWTETIDVAPTCLEGGHANFTCSLCGETYEQILSAKGHNWTVKEHVNTVYGENGVIVTQGHTLYECSACGEQWYTETAAPPPDVSGGSNILAWLQEFKTWLGDKLDNLFQGDGDANNFWSTNKKSFTDVLSSLLQTLLDFLTDILEKLLGLVKDLLSFLFDLISSVVITGISDFFTGLKDSRLFDFVVKDDEGSATALPEGVTTVFAFFSGVILALPVELRSILLFGTAIIVLIGVIKIIKS